MTAEAMRTNPEAALIADEPFPVLRQHLAAVLAGDEIVGHVVPSSTRYTVGLESPVTLAMCVTFFPAAFISLMA